MPPKKGCGLSPGLVPLVSIDCASSKISWKKYGISLEACALLNAIASARGRACGPTVSWVCEIGTTPPRLTSPIVGFRPTTALTFPGQTMLPSVSLPRLTAVKFAATAAAEPELEPQALRSSEYGLPVSPPRPDQPLVE